jgi:hypothetical protein
LSTFNDRFIGLQSNPDPPPDDPEEDEPELYQMGKYIFEARKTRSGMSFKLKQTKNEEDKNDS